MWAQTHNNGHRYYREQRGSRGAGYCVDRSGSILCHVPDEQMDRIIGAIVLPEAWLDRVLAHVHLADEVKRVSEECAQVEQRLRRLAQVCLDGLKEDQEYRREKRLLEDKLEGLLVPGVDAAKEAGKLLEDLPQLWEDTNPNEKRRLLLTILDAVYVDTVKDKSIVAIRPKPAFIPIFEVANAREGSGVVLIIESKLPLAIHGLETTNPCFWWRRGGVEPYLKHGLVVLKTEVDPKIRTGG